jgi:hypothetical protein
MNASSRDSDKKYSRFVQLRQYVNTVGLGLVEVFSLVGAVICMANNCLSLARTMILFSIYILLVRRL